MPLEARDKYWSAIGLTLSDCSPQKWQPGKSLAERLNIYTHGYVHTCIVVNRQLLSWTCSRLMLIVSKMLGRCSES